MFPADVSAQFPYTHTTLIHGFNDNSTRFRTPNTPGLLSSYVNLKEVQTPSLTGELSIDDQASNLRPYLVGSHVLYGLSMGGLTARSAYFANNAGIWGIVTVATPHHGAWIANNATQVTGYIGDVVSDFFLTVYDILYRPQPTTILSAVTVDLFRYVASQYVQIYVRGYLNTQFGTKSRALYDIRVESPTIARLNVADGVPHANVFGTIGRRNAVFRLAFSSLYRDSEFDSFVRKKNRLKSAAKACRQIGYNIIIRTQVGRACNQVDNIIGSIDDRWAYWTLGPVAKRSPATFDGLIPTSTSRYPGTSLGDLINFHAVTTNHMNVQYKSEGIAATVRAMFHIGMEQAPTPPDDGSGSGGGYSCDPGDPKLICVQ
ncbi:MAG: hypothetical protein ABIV11_08340 [Gemmatimonadaceae bacterium]